eukprot:EC783263.1.p3 GENE.EC783263.1~~EC783263.1.p3  ORF type:complete len:62 (+),score=16.82 EC783263.1:43-228(+)
MSDWNYSWNANESASSNSSIPTVNVNGTIGHASGTFQGQAQASVGGNGWSETAGIGGHGSF